MVAVSLPVDRSRSRNPWLELPAGSEYVLREDKGAIEAFNARASVWHQIHWEIVPEPYLGDPNAPVVLLNLNPGFVESDQVVHTDNVFNGAAIENLEHRRAVFPLYLLDPSLPESPGRSWWTKKLRALIAATDLEAVANRVFVVEIHGYHSKRFSPRLKVPSQQYSRELLISALNRRAELVVMRGVRHWLDLVPELSRVPALKVVRNVQNPTISPKNVSTFQRMVDAIRYS